jgi:plasmid stabilization system protein ParE
MNRQLIIRPEAEAEMAEAFDWYEKRVSGLGTSFLLSVEAVMQAILRNPQQYPRRHGIVRCALLRRFPYEVFFVENDERIVVLAVFHARRNPKRWQTRF